MTRNNEPWSDKGWVPGHFEFSPCCGAAIQASLADGVLAGSCAKCGAWVARINPKTGVQEITCGSVLERLGKNES